MALRRALVVGPTGRPDEIEDGDTLVADRISANVATFPEWRGQSLASDGQVGQAQTDFAGEVAAVEAQGYNGDIDNRRLAATYYGSGAPYPLLSLARSRGAPGTFSYVLANNLLGAVEWWGASASAAAMARLAAIECAATANHASGDMPTKLSVSVTPPASATPAVVAVFDSNGLQVQGVRLKGERQVVFEFSAGGVALQAGAQTNPVVMPWDYQITKVTTLADAAGSCIVDIWKDTYANYPPVDADSITAAAPPSLAGVRKSQDSTLTGWTKTGSAGDVLIAHLDSVTGLKTLSVILTVVPT